MPAKRRILERRRHPPIGAEALRLWRACLALERQGAPRRFHDEYLATGRKLAIECGLDWAAMWWPTDARTARLPANLVDRPLQARAWQQARAARLALIKAEAAAALVKGLKSSPGDFSPDFEGE
jgi:hypothetical protein